MMNIPQWPIGGERELELLKEVLDSIQWGGYHEFIGRFEKAVRGFPTFHLRRDRRQWNG